MFSQYHILAQKHRDASAIELHLCAIEFNLCAIEFHLCFVYGVYLMLLHL